MDYNFNDDFKNEIPLITIKLILSFNKNSLQNIFNEINLKQAIISEEKWIYGSKEFTVFELLDAEKIFIQDIELYLAKIKNIKDKYNGNSKILIDIKIENTAPIIVFGRKILDMAGYLESCIELNIISASTDNDSLKNNKNSELYGEYTLFSKNDEEIPIDTIANEISLPFIKRIKGELIEPENGERVFEESFLQYTSGVFYKSPAEVLEKLYSSLYMQKNQIINAIKKFNLGGDLSIVFNLLEFRNIIIPSNLVILLCELKAHLAFDVYL